MSVMPPSVTTVVEAPIAEPGQTTTEFIGKSALQILTMGIALFAVLGHGLSVEHQTTIMALAGTFITVLEGAYSLSRGTRKSGTAG